MQFIHGLESSPHGQKARFLAEHFRSRAPAMDTRDFAASLELQARALREEPPDVLVGSSFGGALAVALLGRGDWHGPTLLLAPAAARLGVGDELPAGVPVIIAHGVHDDVVPLEDSRKLARGGTPGLVRLYEIDDGHRLESLVESSRLAELVREVFELAG